MDVIESRMVMALIVILALMTPGSFADTESHASETKGQQTHSCPLILDQEMIEIDLDSPEEIRKFGELLRWLEPKWLPLETILPHIERSPFYPEIRTIEPTPVSMGKHHQCHRADLVDGRIGFIRVRTSSP